MARSGLLVTGAAAVAANLGNPAGQGAYRLGLKPASRSSRPTVSLIHFTGSLIHFTVVPSVGSLHPSLSI